MESVETLLNRKPFNDLRYEQLRALAEKFHRKVYAEGEPLVRAGEPVEGVGIICSGQASVSVCLSKDKSNYIQNIEKAEIFGEISLLTFQPSFFEIIPIDTVVCYFMPYHEFHKITNAFPEIKGVFYEVALKKMSLIFNFLDVGENLFSFSEKANEKSNYPSYFQKAIEYIDRHFRSNITLNALASESGINKYQLSRSFKSMIGISFKQYLNQKRIEEAKNILKTQKVSITEVCFFVGFNDLSHFSKLFKAMTKINPKEYRDSCAD